MVGTRWGGKRLRNSWLLVCGLRNPTDPLELDPKTQRSVRWEYLKCGDDNSLRTSPATARLVGAVNTTSASSSLPRAKTIPNIILRSTVVAAAGVFRNHKQTAQVGIRGSGENSSLGRIEIRVEGGLDKIVRHFLLSRWPSGRAKGRHSCAEAVARPTEIPIFAECPTTTPPKQPCRSRNRARTWPVLRRKPITPRKIAVVVFLLSSR